MRRWNRWGVGAVLWAAAGLAGAGSIVDSMHNMSFFSFGGEICNYCHTPHNAQAVANAPLWSHAPSTATYQIYASPSLNATVGQPGTISKLCLSCHDGTIGISDFSPGGFSGGITFGPGDTGYIGTDLRNDHPIGFTYNTALASADGSLFDPSVKDVTIGSAGKVKTGKIADVLLFGGQLECASCHDVHNSYTADPAMYTGLLKITATGSKLCLACHDK